MTDSITTAHLGMSLRDWFAGQALAGLVSDTNMTTTIIDAQLAYALADAMLRVREDSEQFER